MTLPQLYACIEGWNRAQAGGQGSAEPPSDEEFMAMCAAHDAIEARLVERRQGEG